MKKQITIEVTTDNLTEKAPLYHQYQGQCNAQGAYIELNPRNGSLKADWNAEIGSAIPMELFHHRLVWFAVDPQSSADSLIELFEDEDFLALCQSVVDGYSEEWDGNNTVGKYSDAAQLAFEELERRSNYDNFGLECISVCDASEYLFANCYLTEFWDNQPLAEAVVSIESGIEPDWDVRGDIEEALIEQARELVEYEEWERLTQTHITELLERDLISEEIAEDWRKDHAVTQAEGHIEIAKKEGFSEISAGVVLAEQSYIIADQEGWADEDPSKNIDLTQHKYWLWADDCAPLVGLDDAEDIADYFDGEFYAAGTTNYLK